MKELCSAEKPSLKTDNIETTKHKSPFMTDYEAVAYLESRRKRKKTLNDLILEACIQWVENERKKEEKK